MVAWPGWQTNAYHAMTQALPTSENWTNPDGPLGAAMNSAVSKFLPELLQATQLVERAVEKGMALVEFEKEYGNFYHTAALDGHEDGIPATIEHRLSKVIHLHAAVQDILDRTYHDSGSTNPDTLKSMGRMTLSEADRQFRQLPTQYDIPGMVRELERI